MEARRDEREWAEIAAMQAESLHRREVEEAHLKHLTAQKLQDEYARQIQRKQLSKAAEAELQRQESLLSQRRSTALEQQQSRLRRVQLALTTQQRREYEEHCDSVKQRRGQEKEQQIRVEQAQLKTLGEDLTKEIEFQRQWKQLQIAEEQQALERALASQKQAKSAVLREKEEERSRIRYNLQKAEERDRKLRDMRRSISQKMEARERSYWQVSKAEAEKHGKLQQWLEGNEQRAAAQLQAKDATFQDWKAQAQHEVLATLSRQKQELESRRLQRVLASDQEKQEMAQLDRHNRDMDAKVREYRRVEADRYRAHLDQQLVAKKSDAVNDSRLSPKERSINADLFRRREEGKPVDFASVPGLQSHSPLKQTFQRAFRVTAETPTLRYAQTPTPTAFATVWDSPARHSPTEALDPVSTSFELSYDPSRHNPIVNPIGDSIPRPTRPLSLAKGKGLQSLFNAAKAVVNPAPNY